MKEKVATAFRFESISEVRDNLADFTLHLFAILGLPAIVVSLLRIREFGWIASMWVHLGVYALIVALWAVRRKVSYRIKAGAVLGLLFVLGSASYPSLATAGSGVFFYLVIVVLATLYYGFRGGLAAMILCLAGIVTAMAATMAGYISPRVDLDAYALSLSSWGGKLAVFTLLAGLCLGLMSLMQGWLTGSIREMKQEIEERRQAQEHLASSLAEKDILLREVHHRVKSNLQVIMSLLDLYLSRAAVPSDARAIADSRDRIRVMAQIHENLYRTGDLARINFSLFLEELLSGTMATYPNQRGKVRLDMQAEPITLNMDTAIPCGLIVNELVSNSFQYAFEPGQKGSISVTVSSLEDDRYRLVVADDGRGFSSMEPGGGEFHFGMKLVEALSSQLGAQTTLTTDRGTEFTMVFAEYTEAGAEIY